MTTMERPTLSFFQSRSAVSAGMLRDSASARHVRSPSDNPRREILAAHGRAWARPRLSKPREERPRLGLHAAMGQSGPHPKPGVDLRR